MKLVNFELEGKVYGLHHNQARVVGRQMKSGNKERAERLIRRYALRVEDSKGNVEKEAPEEAPSGVTQGGISTASF